VFGPEDPRFNGEAARSDELTPLLKELLRLVRFETRSDPSSSEVTRYVVTIDSIPRMTHLQTRRDAYPVTVVSEGTQPVAVGGR